jgi:chemotaxis response regulator CheB
MKRVVLYGKSLVMSTISASLRDCPDLQVLPVDPSVPDAQQHVSEIRPDVVIFDLAEIQPNFATSLWQVQSELVLIGVDLMTGKALVLSSQPARALTTNDLLQLLRHNDPSTPVNGATSHEMRQN